MLQLSPMVDFLLALVRRTPSFFRSRQSLLLENLALRQQVTRPEEAPRDEGLFSLRQMPLALVTDRDKRRSVRAS